MIYIKIENKKIQGKQKKFEKYDLNYNKGCDREINPIPKNLSGNRNYIIKK